MGAWRLAESLKELRRDVDGLYPHRDKTSDGAIGDAQHASRSSDHNPWVRDFHGIGVVTAIDIDADLAPNLNVGVLAKWLIATRDSRIKYIIFNRQITASYPVGSTPAWTPRPYHGANAHQHHMHISVKSDPGHYDSTAVWNLSGLHGESPLEIPQIQKPREEQAGAPAVQSQAVAASASAGGAQSAAGSEHSITDPQLPDPPPALESAGGSEGEKGAVQNAENITNVQTGDKTVPDNFVPEDKTVDAPAKEDSTKKATVMTVGGFAVPAFLVGFIHAVQSLISQGFIDAASIGNAVLQFIQNNTKFVFAGLGLVIGGMMLKKLYKQVTLWLSMYIAARADMHNVTVKPQ